MKRIVVFSLNYYPFVGGAEVAIREITNRISSDEIEFHLIAYRFNSELSETERIGNVIVHRIGIGKRGATVADSFNALAYLGKIAYIPLAALKALELHRRHPFNGAWAMMSYMVFPIVLMRMAGKRIPYLITLQEGDPFEHVFSRWHIRFVLPLLRYGFSHASTVQAISTFLGTWAAKFGFKGMLQIVPNGVDVSRFTVPPPKEVEQARRALGKADSDVFLVTTSRLVHKNGIDTVIRAMPHLPDHTTFLIYGDGPEERHLRMLAEELHVASRVRFMGQISHKALPATLAACDIFIRPSRSEGMGNSFIEAMAAGVPVIATQVGGISDFLFDKRLDAEHEPTGWAIQPETPKDIAEAVSYILSNEDERRNIIENARRLVMDTYDWDHIATKMRLIFLNLVK
ncbi:MAG TPA: glycosyltransferase family 4 protein [Candidatus Paceibacterota bacterium]|nr:glycosyltransferase family 4 protein [Candidatus Paceibacterota bacterium]